MCSCIHSSRVGRRAPTGAGPFGLPPLALALALTTSLTLARAEQPPPEPRQLLEELNRVSIDASQIYTLRNVQIVRDRIRLYFNSGFIGFFGKTGGEITGAIFSGDGEVLLTPPSSAEKRS